MVNCSATFDCSSNDKDISATPTTISCAADPCTETECCTVTAATSDVDTLKIDVAAIQAKMTTMETSLNKIKNNVTTLSKKAEKNGGEEEDSESWFSFDPSSWFGDDEEGAEGFANKDNKLFFIIAIIIIIFYSLKR